MTNRFSHITALKKTSDAALSRQVSQRETQVRGKPAKIQLGRDAYETLLGLMAEAPEDPTTPLGVFVANSTKRILKKQIEEVFVP